jgi:glycolate oxidase FAD binding subunit
VTIAAAFAPYIRPVVAVGGLPECDLLVAPQTIEELERILDLASEHQLKALVWGGGAHQGLGGRIDPDLVIATAQLNRLIDWQPEDFTITVEAGMRVSDLEKMLADRGQMAVLPELPGAATVGGVMAAGVSGWRRARYGPTRDRVLEVDLVTGDGRRIRAGGRVVKNVTGFDLPRLAVGSYGSLGVIAQTCLKLWPEPSTKVTVSVADGDRALAAAYRPTAVVEAEGVAKVYLGGTEAEVDGQVEALGGTVVSGWSWEPEPAGVVGWSLRVPPASTRLAIKRLPSGWRYQAGLGVGEIKAASFDAEGAVELRAWAESQGGALVIVSGPAGLYSEMDPWGTPPPGLDIQRELIRRFDPCRVVNPGRLPGGI